MAFKKTKRDVSVPSSPSELFLELSTRKYSNVLLHQGQIIEDYVTNGLDKSDVSLELPTGSGKTLVGLLIGEWRRRKFKEKVVFLCPTRQLVNQVVEEAKSKYGLSVVGYTGSIKNYTAEQKANYGFNNAVSVTTYSSLFNANPFFKDADLLILDDAHACENYLGQFWSLNIERQNGDHKDLHTQIANLVSPYLRPADQDRLLGRHINKSDASWVDKLPTRHFVDIRDTLYKVLDENVESAGLGYSWRTLRDNFHACHVYVSSTEILIRPSTFPTWEHGAFSTPKQRLYMSATLSMGGDLERTTGRTKIHKIAAPESFKLHGIGRRFFMFPDITLDAKKCEKLTKKLISLSGRALYLVPSMKARKAVIESLTSESGLEIFDAAELEESKEAFVEANHAIAVLANRYDGIDLRGDACRLLFIEGLPRAMNLHERFLMDKMAASILFDERVQTRVIQAVGRCTRSLEDYSAVVVLGQDIPDYLINERNTCYLHPNLQAELKFGKEQSNDVSYDDFVENMEIFLAQGSDWEEVNSEIIDARNKITKEEFPDIQFLSTSVKDEINYQKHLWNADFERAVESAETVIGILNGPGSLRGYRAWWHYLAGAACELASEENPAFKDRARDHFTKARAAANTLQWLVSLSKDTQAQLQGPGNADCDLQQISKIEDILAHLGATNHKRFEAHVSSISTGILADDFKRFEAALKDLGELLGFDSSNEQTDGAPDGWWVAGDECIVFEAHSQAIDGTVIGSKKARQVASHPTWLRENGKISANTNAISVLITPCTSIKKEASGLLEDAKFSGLENFRNWACGAITVIREIRRTFNKPGDLAWRGDAMTRLSKRQLLASELVARFSETLAKDRLTPAP